MDPHDPSDAVSEALRDHQLRSHRLIDRLMRADGPSVAQTRLLAHIARAGDARSTDLAGAFGYAPRTVTEAVDGLERDGLLRRLPDPADRRAKLIRLTKSGAAAAATAEALRRRYLREVFGALTPAECEDMLRLIAKLNRRLAELGG